VAAYRDEAALADCNRAIELDAASARAIGCRTETLRLLGLHDQALGDWQPIPRTPTH
jgi:hypothetical protein